MLLPSQLIQIVKNKIQRANISSFTPKPFPLDKRKEIFDKYFSGDVITFEHTINREMNW